jgi:hypothetical protein
MSCPRCDICAAHCSQSVHIAMHRAAHVLRSAPKNIQHPLPRSKTMAVSRIWRNSRDIRTRVKPRADATRCVDLRHLVTASKAHVTKATSVPAEQVQHGAIGGQSVVVTWTRDLAREGNLRPCIRRSAGAGCAKQQHADPQYCARGRQLGAPVFLHYEPGKPLKFSDPSRKPLRTLSEGQPLM